MGTAYIFKSNFIKVFFLIKYFKIDRISGSMSKIIKKNSKLNSKKFEDKTELHNSSTKNIFYLNKAAYRFFFKKRQ